MSDLLAYSVQGLDNTGAFESGEGSGDGNPDSRADSLESRSSTSVQQSNPSSIIPTTSFDNSMVYNSYAGVDIVAHMVLPGEEPVELGELQTFSYSSHRENVPVRTLGHSSPIGFVKGSRTIAGSMIFTVFNNYAFYRFRTFQHAIANRLYPVADMLPPMDMVLTFSNEYGSLSKMKVYGVTFVDEGATMSIDDLITESTMSYMARGIQPLTGYYDQTG